MIRKLFICILFLVIGALAQANFDLSPTLASHHDQSSLHTLEGAVADLQAGQTALEQGALQYMTVVTGAINGMPGPHILITGVNVHFRSGEGVTNGADTGVGNVVVGYNEEPLGGLIAGDRDGTHNLIVGPQHKYLSFGGFLAGRDNATSGDYASVSGGNGNTASGLQASVSGGFANTASGVGSNVSGGVLSTASNLYASVSGGQGNTASGDRSSVSGGTANTASGSFANVSGGASRTASGPGDWVAGTLFQDF